MLVSWADWAISQTRGRKDQHLLITWDKQWVQDLVLVGRDRRRLETISFRNFLVNNTNLVVSRNKFVLCKECVGKPRAFWCEWLLHTRPHIIRFEEMPLDNINGCCVSCGSISYWVAVNEGMMPLFIKHVAKVILEQFNFIKIERKRSQYPVYKLFWCYKLLYVVVTFECPIIEPCTFMSKSQIGSLWMDPNLYRFIVVWYSTSLLWN